MLVQERHSVELVVLLLQHGLAKMGLTELLDQQGT